MKELFPQIVRFYFQKTTNSLFQDDNRLTHKGFVRNKKSTKIFKRFTTFHVQQTFGDGM